MTSTSKKMKIRSLTRDQRGREKKRGEHYKMMSNTKRGNDKKQTVWGSNIHRN